MFAVVVTFKIKPEHADAFRPLMLRNAHASLKDEPGCHQFDVCEDPARPGEIFLYELYSDSEAFEAHKVTPHFLSFDAETSDMIAEKIVSTYREVHQ